MKTKLYISDKKVIFLELMKTLHIEGQVILANGSVLDIQDYGGYVITSEGATDTEGTSCACGFDQEKLFYELLCDWDEYVSSE